MTRLSRVLGAIAIAVLPGKAMPAQTATPATPTISDNSFLIEEAYNQERGVVQHISSFERVRGSGDWSYTFTQEWPLGGERNQLSYTVPVQGSGGIARLGDVALNYRYQLVGTESRLSLAPRLTVIAPTGSVAAGTGAGGVGLQLNVPLSIAVAPWLVTHWNAGTTVTPSARNGAGDHATTTDVNLGASAIWRPLPTFNVLVEAVWSQSRTVTGPGITARDREAVISPGIRWAHNVRGGLQIVPGIALPIGVGPSRGHNALFLYLSFEHPFKRVAS